MVVSRIEYQFANLTLDLRNQEPVPLGKLLIWQLQRRCDRSPKLQILGQTLELRCVITLEYHSLLQNS